MTKLLNTRDDAGLEKDSLVAVVPFGNTVRASRYESFVHTHDLDPKLPVLEGHFPAAGFPLKQDLLTHCGVGLIEFAPLCPPVVMFTLQAGPTATHWFANVCDETTWDLLAAWDSFGTMALAANLDDGRVLFGVDRYRIGKESLGRLRGVFGDRNMYEQFGPAFARMMALLCAHDGIGNVAVSRLPEYPEVQHACMNVVCTERTDLVTIPTNSLPARHHLYPSHACGFTKTAD